MAGQEYKGREKTVQKMSRDGLTEENLQSGSVRQVGRREKELLSDGRSETCAPVGAQVGEKGAAGRNRKARRFSQEAMHSRDAPVSDEPDAEMQAVSDTGSKYSKQKRLARYAGSAKEKATATAHPNKEKDSLDEVREGSYSRKLREHERVPDGEGLSEKKGDVRKKQKQKRLAVEQKKTGRLAFDDEGRTMVQGAGAGIGKKIVGTASTMAGGYVREKLNESSDDNAGTESLSATGTASENAGRALREVQRKASRSDSRRNRLRMSHSDTDAGTRLRFGEGKLEDEIGQTAANSTKEAVNKRVRAKEMNRLFQRNRYKAAYRAARTGEAVAGNGAGAVVQESITVKAKRAAKEMLVRSRSLLLGAGLFALLFIIISVAISSCASSIQSGGSVIGITTYPESDEDIYAAEDAYAALEAALNAQINNMESTHPGYDVYRYNVDEINHNPYHLISYLNAKYGDWKYDDIKDELQALFEAQYHLSTSSTTETRTEERTVRVGESLGQVVTSGYCNCSLCCGQWAGGPTASGVMPQANHTIAVDANNPTVPMGTKLVMNGVEYVVEDTGNFDRYGVDFDVYYDSHSAASAHGHQTWEAYLADDNGSQEITVTTTVTERIFSVTLTNSSFDVVARANLTDEQQVLYDALNRTLGNRDYLWDINTIVLGDGMSYEIPPEALTDERFRRMITEAEKYLGYPYVWGGSSPSTSFDCSGFVSWVVNHCGNGWNYGRLTADGLRSVCTYVSPSEAKPGDLIFFQKTYNTSGASHIGIYVGNGMMIHCGSPIKYSNINTSYWQEHFLCFGRLP